MNRVVTPPLKPPLKASSSLWTGIGVLFGELDLDVGLAAADQRRAADFARGLAGPRLQLPRGTGGDSLDVDAAVLVAFDEEFLQRRGCGSAGSSDAIFAATLKVIGVGFVFEITFGVNPPLYCTSRSPTITFCHGAATATPTTASSDCKHDNCEPRRLTPSFSHYYLPQ